MKNQFSGKFILRLPPDLHKKLVLDSRQKGLSLNQYCESLLGSKQASSLSPKHYHSVPPGFPLSLILEQAQSWGLSIEQLILFGSYVRGKTTESSDIDLLIVLKKTQTPVRDLYRKWDKTIAPNILGSFSRLSPHFVTLPSGWETAGSLWFETALDGETVWKRNSNTDKILKQIRTAMASGKLIRKLSHGHPYWIRRQEGANEK